MTQKMNFTNDQVAFEYAVYMILGSYFKKTNCVSRRTEQKYHLQYCEQKQSNQFKMEDMCIRYANQNLLTKLPKKFWQQEMQVYLLPDEETGLTEIRFMSEKCILRVLAEYKGKKSVIRHELWTRRVPATGEKKSPDKKRPKAAGKAA